MKSEWPDKYEPKSIEEMVMDPAIKANILEQVNNGSIKNMSLIGRPGIGKTLLATLIAKKLNAIVLFINASEENGIDMVRSKVLDFANSCSLDGRMKIVILDEFDGATIACQDALRHVVKTSADDTRYIITANKNVEVSDAMKSRCIPFLLSFTTKDATIRLIDILKKENIPVDKDVITSIVENIISKKFPDLRTCISMLELCCTSGKYVFVETANTNTEVVETILKLVKSDVKKAREYWIKNEAQFNSDYITLAGHIFNTMDTSDKMLLVAEYIYRMNLVIDKEIQFYAMMLQLGK